MLATSPVDWIWAGIAWLSAAYPLWRLWHQRGAAGTRELFFVTLAFAVYPTALAVFHLTPFDLGMVYAINVVVPALYCFSMLNYLGVPFPGLTVVRRCAYGASAALGVLALTNVWHGWYGTFQTYTPGTPNHMLTHQEPGFGLIAMSVVSAVLVIVPAVITAAQYLRARFSGPRWLITLVLPLAALLSFLSPVRMPLLEELQISGFILTTTVMLVALNYAIVKNHFSEIGLVTRANIISLIPDALVVVGRAGRVVDCNDAFELMCSENHHSIIGKPLAAVAPAIDHLLKEHDTGQFDLKWPGYAGIQHIEVRIERFRPHVHSRGGRNSGRMVLLRDVTDQREMLERLSTSQAELRVANAKLKMLSITDELTGLKNRRHFEEQLATELERTARTGGSFGLLSIDLDHFKRVNDQHGHAAGDRALILSAQAMQHECRTTDTLARIGGEEFMVLLVDAEPRSLRQTAERFRAAIAANTLSTNGGSTVELTASIGATMTEPGDSLEGVYRRLDQALYAAKGSGRNRVVVADQPNETASIVA